MPHIETCKDMIDVRRNIDRLDEIIVPLLVERAAYVAQAAQFKPTKNDVVIPSRIEEVVNHARRLAQQAGGDPALLEAIYRAMIDAYCTFEAREWDRLRA